MKLEIAELECSSTIHLECLMFPMKHKHLINSVVILLHFQLVLVTTCSSNIRLPSTKKLVIHLFRCTVGGVDLHFEFRLPVDFALSSKRTNLWKLHIKDFP